MSVLASRRVESKMEFLNTAHELELYTIKLSMKENAIPKRYRFTIAVPLTNSARALNQYITYANGIYPTNREEYLERRKYQKRAILEIKNMYEVMRIATEILPIKGTIVERWTSLITTEENVLRKWINSDKQRYKELK